MKKLMVTVMAAAGLMAGVVGSAGAMSVTSTDAWDITQGAVVTSTSGIHPAGSAAGMFGNDAGPNSPFPVERLNTLFRDLAPEGTVHAIEWRSVTPITLAGYHLLSYEDVNEGRSFSQFRLFAKVNGVFDLISDVATKGAADLYVNHTLDMTVAVNKVIAQEFRAEFVQFKEFFGQSGSRVVELDAINVVPLPASAWMGLSLLGGLGVARRRRKLSRV
jgi:hypothetical protein